MIISNDELLYNIKKYKNEILNEIKKKNDIIKNEFIISYYTINYNSEFFDNNLINTNIDKLFIDLIKKINKPKKNTKKIYEKIEYIPI